MIRQIILIDQEKCNECGACVNACHEGAIGMQNGKAVLLRDDYCDGLGNCLPVCPTGAITFEEREALPYDEAAVLARQKPAAPLPCGCPGSQARSLTPMPGPAVHAAPQAQGTSCLRQWPVQLKLVPVQAEWLRDAHVLVAADCCAYARDGFHREFMQGKVTLIGCPKLDGVDYAEKLAAILRAQPIASLSVVRMSVPCCGGLADAARRAVAMSGKNIEVNISTITPEGTLI